MKNNKPVFNICLRVILPILIVMTVMVMALTYLMVWKSCNTVSAEDKETSESGILTDVALLQTRDRGKYYEVYNVNSEVIAFCVSEDQLDQIPSMAGSYYPVAYWSGQYQTMDLSQGFDIVRQYWLSEDSLLSQVKVYDFSAYKGHTQTMGRGPGILLAFLWMAELMVGGILILLDIIGGFTIFGINCGRKKNL